MIGRIVRGAASGVLATLLMTAVMYAGKLVGLLQTPPPKHITAEAGRKAGMPPEKAPPGTFQFAWIASHFGYGVGSGILFALISPLLPKRAALSGSLYGVALWAISYLKIMPELGLFPHPDDDSRGRTAVMIAAHEVYGVTPAKTGGQ